MFSHLAKNRPILLLFPLLVAQLALLSLQVRDSQGTSLLRRSVLRVLSPFLTATQVVVRGVDTVWSEYVDVREARNENDELRRQIEALTTEVRQNAALVEQARRVQGLQELQSRLPLRSITANVIGRSPTFLSFTIILDRGAHHGVRKDDPVMAREGVVGRVLDVLPSSCEVQVILDADAAVGAMLARTRTQGNLAGRGSPFLKLNYVLNQEDVRAGDLVVTSGLDSIYPKDLPVGHVVRLDRGESVFKEIDVLPLVHFNRLEEVVILVEQRQNR